MSPLPKVVVVGAGAFGGWTALSLRLQGVDVTLLDAWGPGHPRASSGGETRIIRATYGPRRIYTRLAARALRLWKAHDEAWGHGCLTTTGAIWMSGADDQFGRDSLAALEAENIPAEWMDAKTAARRWPQVDFSGITSILHEPEAGFLHARRACAAVVERFVSLGGTYRVASVAPPDDPRTVRLTDGSIVPADVVVYACGPWLGTLFPSVIGSRISPTRQVVHYFGVPDGDRSFFSPHFPIWLELGDAVMYGFPADDERGLKIADDTSGPPIDPTTDLRVIVEDDSIRVREYLGRRFPALAEAPWLSGEVCQYEATPDSHFIIDTHPDTTRVWIVGGGSGHGFKMGPAIGELMTVAVLGEVAPDPTFSLHRFASLVPERDERVDRRASPGRNPAGDSRDHQHQKWHSEK
jgi:sarcosine oxidase